MTIEKSLTPEKEKRKSEKKVEKSAGTGFQLAQIRIFIAEVKSEFGKVAWPNRKNTAGSALLVVILVSIMSLYLGAVDLVLGKLISYILK
jgi:preprotein translocase subunit SecE